MKTPADKTITLTLYSHPMKDPKLRWKAQVVFAPGSTDATPARITMKDGVGEPVESGVFEFAGRKTPIEGGIGTIGCGDFAAGRHEPSIWLYREGYAPVPGALTFE